MLHIRSIVMIAGVLLASCSPRSSVQGTGDAATTTKQRGWISLFDGKTTNGWTSYGKPAAGEAWKAENGVLFLDASVKGKGGDLIHEMELENFHLKLEWKISKDGNSGIIFWAQNDPQKYKYVWYTGPEMQIIDNDGHPDGKITKHRAGDLYDLVSALPESAKAVGEWNQVEVICNKGSLELILNGTKVVSTRYDDENWKNMIANSKFKPLADFGRIAKGHIALQDHGNNVWFRNIMVRKL